MPFKSFIEYLLHEKKYSLHTVTSYKKDLESFYEFINAEYGSSQIDEVNYQQIRLWIVSLVESGISNRTVNRKISALNSYYKFLIKIEQIKASPLAKHKALKTNKKVQIPFSEQEMKTVINELHHDTDFEGLRNRLIIEMFYATGIRRIELVQIKLSDIDLSNNTLKVLGKRNKDGIFR